MNHRSERYPLCFYFNKKKSSQKMCRLYTPSKTERQSRKQVSGHTGANSWIRCSLTICHTQTLQLENRSLARNLEIVKHNSV